MVLSEKTIHYAWSVYAPLVLIVGTACNAISFIVFSRKVFRRNATTVYLRSLSVAYGASLWALFILLCGTDVTNPQLVYPVSDWWCKLSWYAIFVTQPLENWFTLGFLWKSTMTTYFNDSVDFMLGRYFVIVCMVLLVISTPMLCLRAVPHFIFDGPIVPYIRHNVKEKETANFIRVFRSSVFEAARQCSFSTSGVGTYETFTHDMSTCCLLYLGLFPILLSLFTCEFMLYKYVDDQMNNSTPICRENHLSIMVYSFSLSMLCVNVIILYFLQMAANGAVLAQWSHLQFHAFMALSCFLRAVGVFLICVLNQDSRRDFVKFLRVHGI